MILALVHDHKNFCERILSYQKHKEENVINIYEKIKQHERHTLKDIQ